MEEVTTESIIKDLSEKRLKAKSLMKEKDKELTWEDMREIHCITLNLRQHLGASVFGEPLYQEVLKLFKEWKEK